MKYLILISILLLPILNLAQHEFAPIGAEWYYNKQRSYNPPKFGFTKLTSIKDSVIENKKVRVIEVIDAPNDSTRTIEGYEYLHQNGDTIWYWKGGQFHMLYNFAMQKGDSILLYSEMLNRCGENPYGWNRVDSVFTRTFNEIELKSYYTLPINNSVWEFSNYSFEIFGNLHYLLPQNSNCIYDGIDWYGPLRCYSDPINGILITQKNFKCDSTTTYPLRVKAFQNTDFLTIYPVPVECELTIQFQNNSLTNKNVELEIIDTRGISIRRYKCAIDKIDVSDLPNGTYFLILSLNNKHIDYEKFIKL